MDMHLVPVLLLYYYTCVLARVVVMWVVCIVQNSEPLCLQEVSAQFFIDTMMSAAEFAQAVVGRHKCRWLVEGEEVEEWLFVVAKYTDDDFDESDQSQRAENADQHGDSDKQNAGQHDVYGQCEWQ